MFYSQSITVLANPLLPLSPPSAESTSSSPSLRESEETLKRKNQIKNKSLQIIKAYKHFEKKKNYAGQEFCLITLEEYLNPIEELQLNGLVEELLTAKEENKSLKPYKEKFKKTGLYEIAIFFADYELKEQELTLTQRSLRYIEHNKNRLAVNGLILLRKASFACLPVLTYLLRNTVSYLFSNNNEVFLRRNISKPGFPVKIIPKEELSDKLPYEELEGIEEIIQDWQKAKNTLDEASEDQSSNAQRLNDPTNELFKGYSSRLQLIWKKTCGYYPDLKGRALFSKLNSSQLKSFLSGLSKAAYGDGSYPDLESWKNEGKEEIANVMQNLQRKLEETDMGNKLNFTDDQTKSGDTKKKEYEETFKGYSMSERDFFKSSIVYNGGNFFSSFIQNAINHTCASLIFPNKQVTKDSISPYFSAGGYSIVFHAMNYFSKKTFEKRIEDYKKSRVAPVSESFLEPGNLFMEGAAKSFFSYFEEPDLTNTLLSFFPFVIIHRLTKYGIDNFNKNIKKEEEEVYTYLREFLKR